MMVIFLIFWRDLIIILQSKIIRGIDIRNSLRIIKRIVMLTNTFPKVHKS